MLRFLLSSIVLSITACSHKSGEGASVFFGGVIVNPTSDYVVLYRNDSAIDSVPLDKQHRFAFTLKGIEEGLYHFDHSPELQYIYLQEGDSTYLRLNTMEFDESLVFSGKGSEINNFLIETFLAHEHEASLVDTYYALDPNAFSKKIDSLRATKTRHLQEIATAHTLSEKAVAVAKAAIDYNSFAYKEKYPFFHKKKTGEDLLHKLPSTFYAYRKDLDFNNRELAYFKPYFSFMKYHFGNLSYTTCQGQCDKESHIKDYLHFSTHKLQLVDSLAEEEELRNLLFRNVTMNYLLKEHKTGEAVQDFIEKFKTLSTHKKHKSEIEQLYQGIQNLQPHKSLPDLVLTDLHHNPVSLKDISKHHSTVFYFWTGSQESHLKNTIQHIEKLKEEYPDYKFVGINLKTNYSQWVEMVEAHKLDKETQLYGADFEELQTAMVIDGLNKCVIAKDTLVVDGFAHLYTSFL